MRRISLIYPLILLFYRVIRISAAGICKTSFAGSHADEHGRRSARRHSRRRPEDDRSFWTTWCPPCREELPRFQSYYESKQSGVKLVTVNLLNAEKNEQKVKQFIKANKLTFPIVFDKKGEMMKAYKVMTIPTTFSLMKKESWRKRLSAPLL